MLYEEIKSIAMALGELAGKVEEKDWLFIDMARKNLLATAEQVSSLEYNCSILEGETA